MHKPDCLKGRIDFERLQTFAKPLASHLVIAVVAAGMDPKVTPDPNHAPSK
jgi:hypothetical protein